jgi:hypothetical protein
MAMIASGIAPKPTCSVARSGMKDVDVRGDAPLELADRGARQLDRLAVGLDQHVDVGVGQRDVAPRLRHLPVHLGDDDARLVDGGARVVGAEAEAVAAVLVARRDLHERDVAGDRAVGDELCVLRDVARHDVHRAGLDQAPVGADAAHAVQGDAVDGAGLEGVGEHRGEEGANAAELAALAHERFGQRQRLGRSLAHDDAVAGADPVGEAKLRGVDADHFAAPALRAAQVLAERDHALRALQQRPVDHLAFEVDRADAARGRFVVAGDQAPCVVELGVARAEDAVGDLELARQEADLAVVAEVAAGVGVGLEVLVVADLDDRLVDRDDARRLGVQEHVRARVLHFGGAGGAARAELARQVLGAEVDGGDARIGAAQRRRVGDAGDRLEPADDEARLAARRVAVEAAQPMQGRGTAARRFELRDDDAVDVARQRGGEVVEVMVGSGSLTRTVSTPGRRACLRRSATRAAMPARALALWSGGVPSSRSMT